jgi:hypothetical protein
MFDYLSHSLRFATDQAEAAVSSIGLHPYKVNLITIKNDQISFDQIDTSKITTTQRITLADGYRCWDFGDGYLNPQVVFSNSSTVVLAGGQLTNNKALIGPLVYPYNYGGISAGYDPITTFFPAIIPGTTNVQIYVQILGRGLATSGNYYKITEIVFHNKELTENVSFKLKVESIGADP